MAATMHTHNLVSRFSPFPPFPPSHPHLSPFTTSLLPPPLHNTTLSLRSTAARPTHIPAALAELPPPTTSGGDGSDEGPVELPPSSSPSPIFATSNNPTPLQVSTSVLLTGAISLFLFRSLRRRAKRAKEMRVRSTGVKETKDIKVGPLESLKAISSASLDPGKPPSPVQAFLGGLAAGAVAIILYKFTTTIEAALNRQAISDNFSVRQITITVRTIINGLCYLATFVFGINSIGLVLYSGQLAISSFMEPDSSSSASAKKNDAVLNTVASSDGTTDGVESESKDVQKNSNDT